MSEMLERVKEYWDAYLAYLRRVEVTDGAGSSLGFARGVEDAVSLLEERTGAGGKVLFVGNGGSAAIASHFSLDYWHAGGMKAMAFNDGPLLTCLSNDHGYEQVFALPVEAYGEAEDVLCAISSSGNSENIVRAVVAARQRGCAVITLSGFMPGNRLRPLGDLNFYIPVEHYGYVEMGHASILHCILDMKTGTVAPVVPEEAAPPSSVS